MQELHWQFLGLISIQLTFPALCITLYFPKVFWRILGLNPKIELKQFRIARSLETDRFETSLELTQKQSFQEMSSTTNPRVAASNRTSGSPQKPRIFTIFPIGDTRFSAGMPGRSRLAGSPARPWAMMNRSVRCRVFGRAQTELVPIPTAGRVPAGAGRFVRNRRRDHSSRRRRARGRESGLINDV